MRVFVCALVAVIAVAALLVSADEGDAGANAYDNPTPGNFPYRDHHKYCIIGGGGPAGIQTSVNLHKYKMDYAAFERSDHPGSFFDVYPRQRRLISINKVHTGYNDSEFNLRHDWHSLLDQCDDYFWPCADEHEKNSKKKKNNATTTTTSEAPFLFTQLTEEFYPHASVYPKYLNMFLERHKELRIAFNIDVGKVMRAANNQGPFELHIVDNNNNNNNKNDNANEKKKSNKRVVKCDVVIAATGKSVQKQFHLAEGSHLVTTYTDAPTDPAAYRGQEVLILGAANSAFEFANSLQNTAALVHMASRNPPQFAFQSHYVGDVRIPASPIIDAYSLKAQHAILRLSTDDIKHGRLYFDKQRNRIMLRQSPSAEGEMLSMRERMRAEGEDEETPSMDEGGNSGADFQPGKKYGGGAGSSSAVATASQKERDGEYDDLQLRQMRQDRSNAAIDAIDKMTNEAANELFPSRRGYHRVISCLGFKWNDTVFAVAGSSGSDKNFCDGKSDDDLCAKKKTSSTAMAVVAPSTDAGNSYMEVASNFESVNVPNLFVSGALMHFRDFKRSAGGFIHGFRYTTRTLVAGLRERFEGVKFPSIPMYSREDILNRYMFRLTNVSSLYQMQGQLCDVVLINDAPDAGEAPYHYFYDIPLDNIKSKTPDLVSLANAFKKPNLHFLTMNLEFGKDFQGVGVLHHQPQRETYKRKAEKMLWDWSAPTADPDFRLHWSRANPTLPLRPMEKPTAAELKARDEAEMLAKQKQQAKIPQSSGVARVGDGNGGAFAPAAPGKTSLLQPLEEPPVMLPANDDKPPRLNRFLFLHPVIREWKRAPTSTSSSPSDFLTVKYQLQRELRLHEDVLVDFTTYYYGWRPTRKFLEKVLPK